MSFPGDEEDHRRIAYAESPLPWWIVKSRRRLGDGRTTVAPFWRPVHLRNLWSRFYFWTLVIRGY